MTDNKDAIHKPSHYTYSLVEPKQVLLAWGLHHFTANAIEYICRHQHKGEPIKDIQKAVENLQDYIHVLKLEAAKAKKLTDCKQGNEK